VNLHLATYNVFSAIGADLVNSEIIDLVYGKQPLLIRGLENIVAKQIQASDVSLVTTASQAVLSTLLLNCPVLVYDQKVIQ
jgi:hypothetical protein